MKLKAKIILADWVGHLGALLSAFGSLWALAGAVCEGRLECLPAVPFLAAVACTCVVLADWADLQKSRLREKNACRKYRYHDKV